MHFANEVTPYCIFKWAIWSLLYVSQNLDYLLLLFFFFLTLSPSPNICVFYLIFICVSLYIHINFLFFFCFVSVKVILCAVIRCGLVVQVSGRIINDLSNKHYHNSIVILRHQQLNILNYNVVPKLKSKHLPILPKADIIELT